MAEDLNRLSDQAFRARFAAWLDANYPQAWRQTLQRPFRRLRGAEVKDWIGLLNRGGWRSPGLPIEHGGLGLDFTKQAIYREELERIGAARVIDLGDVQLAPTLIMHGDEDQQRTYLPGIISGDHIWCQGYSEPGAGSDLASLSTSGMIEGDKIVVTGQKIWTTHANESTHIFLLVRTSRERRKQDGITFVLMDLATPGVEVRTINNLAGEDEFCEVFFDGARAPVTNIIGPIGEGWSVAKALLGYERIWIGSPGLAASALKVTRHLMSGEDDQGLVDRYAELACDLHDLRALYAAACQRVAHGEAPGAEVSMLKLVATELQQRISAFNLELGGARSAIDGPAIFGGEALDLPWQFLMSRPQAIFAGSNEIQRSLIAKAVLDLPS